jgi:hypothetical protein
MSDIRERTDVRELDPVELAEVMGGSLPPWLLPEPWLPPPLPPWLLF